MCTAYKDYQAGLTHHMLIYRITGVLGEGQFGMVRRGVWRNRHESNSILGVAVKTLKSDSEERDKVKFLQEAAIMAQFKHPNVVSLYGVVNSGGTVSFFPVIEPKCYCCSAMCHVTFVYIDVCFANCLNNNDR